MSSSAGGDAESDTINRHIASLMMESAAPAASNRSWIFQVTLLGVILGMFLALALKTQQSIRRDTGLPSNRLPALASAFRDLREENANLKKAFEAKEMQVARLQKAIAEGTSQAGIVKEELQSLRLLAGLAPAEGPGIIVTLRDSPKKTRANAPLQVLEDYIVHDSDVRNVVNELRAAGAEVIAVNNERIIATTAIRCTGPTTKINDKSFVPPFVITAIGDPDTLSGALRLPGGVYDELDPLGMISIKKVPELRIAGYPGVPRFKHAKLATEVK